MIEAPAGLPRCRGKRLAVLVALGALLTVAVASFCFKGGIFEQYWVLRLKHGDEEGRVLAARYLGEHGSPEAFPLLLKNTARELDRHPEAWVYRSGVISLVAKQPSLCSALLAEADAFNRLREALIPILLTQTDNPQAHVRARAIWHLGCLFLELRDPPLARLEQMRRADPEEPVRRVAQLALRRFEQL